MKKADVLGVLLQLEKLLPGKRGRALATAATLISGIDGKAVEAVSEEETKAAMARARAAEAVDAYREVCRAVLEGYRTGNEFLFRHGTERLYTSMSLCVAELQDLSRSTGADTTESCAEVRMVWAEAMRSIIDKEAGHEETEARHT